MNYNTMTSRQLINVYHNATAKGEAEIANDVLRLAFKALVSEHKTHSEKKLEQLLEAYSEAYLCVYELLEAIAKKREKYTATRTRQMFRNRGTIGAIIRNAENSPSLGFSKLKDAGLLEYSDEYLVCLFSSLFPENIVEKCKNILTENGVLIPAVAAL